MIYSNTEADRLISEMESLILESNDKDEVERDEKLSELYYPTKNSIEYYDYPDDETGDYERLKEKEQLQRRFDTVCEEFETPDDWQAAEMSSMFPDDEGLDGFDWTR